MKATDKYRVKYASITRTPAGHDDIYRLCDTVERLTQVIEDAILYLDGPEDKFFRAQKLRDRMNMILLGL
jgi:hypothetical protein